MGYDKNLAAEELNISDTIVWHDVSKSPFVLYGLDGREEDFLPRRIPAGIAKTISEGVLGNSGYPAGGRIRFYTDSGKIALKAEYGNGYHPTCASASLTYGFDLYICDAEGKEQFGHAFRPQSNEMNHQQAIYSEKEAPYGVNPANGVFYTLYLPCFSEVKKLYVGLEKGCKLEAGMPYVNEKPVIFYGSSITHGAAASRPGNTYESFISQKYNLNYVNLGFAGNAKGELEMAEYLANREMSAFVCDYDHNAKDAEHLKQTHYRLYEMIRKKHPNIPYVVVSKPDFWRNPPANDMRRSVIYATYEKAQKMGDKNVYFVDGEKFFEGDYYGSCTVDGVHPNDLGFYRMAKILGEVVADVMNLQPSGK